MTPAAVLFDLDGVLIDSFEIWRHLLNCALDTHGKPLLTAPEFDAIWGQGMEADIRMFFPGLTVGELQAFYETRFGSFLDRLKVFPDTRPVVEELRLRGQRLAIASNSAPRIIEESLIAADLKGYFPVAVGAGGSLRGKPEPDTLLAALDGLDAKPEEAIFIGDSPYDMEAGLRAGVRTVGLNQDGDFRISRLGELLALPIFHSDSI